MELAAIHWLPETVHGFGSLTHGVGVAVEAGGGPMALVGPMAPVGDVVKAELERATAGKASAR